MAGLPHYTNSKASLNKFEPVYLNQFQVFITCPSVIPVPIGLAGNGAILNEHVTSVNGIAVDKNPSELSQSFKFAKRYYSGAKPDRTTIDLGINFNVNLDENNSAYVYKILRQWSDLVYNPLTGAMGLKRDYATGTIVINLFQKDGTVHKRMVFKDVWPSKPLNDFNLDYIGGATTLYNIDMTFACDHFDDVFN
jgi:hypothetical protein